MEANREFADVLVVRIRCLHCCACILSWSGNCAMRQKRDPSSCAMRHKKRRNQIEILLLKITMNEMQENKKMLQRASATAEKSLRHKTRKLKLVSQRTKKQKE